MSYHNNSRNYNTRNSGRYNQPGTFIPATSSNHQTYEVQAAQPVMQTQAPEPPKVQPQPQHQPKPQQQPQVQSQPQPQPENPIKQEDVDMTAATTEDDRGSSSGYRQPFFKTKLLGIKKITNKERRRRQNALLRRLTSPKNALMCINEMLPNEQITNQFKVEAAPQDSLYFNNGSHNFCAELVLDGVTYKGYGENKLAARNAAAEHAIRDIVLKKMERYSELMAQQAANEADGGAGGGEAAAQAVDAMLEADGSDALPMIQLLSFALHKLFAEWEGAGHTVPQLRARPASQANPEEEGAAAKPHLAPVAAAKPRKLKKIPDNASSMHPAMLLTILRPHAAYRELTAEGDKPQNMIFTIAVDTEDKTYVGRASNKKEARKAAARAACKGILGITFDDESRALAQH